MVYKWTEISKLNQVTVSSVNPEYYLGIKSSLFYIFNFVLLVVLVAYMADSKFITELPNPVKLSLACMLVCF